MTEEPTAEPPDETPTAASREPAEGTWNRSDPEWPVRESVIAWETPFFEAGYDVVERPDGEEANYYWLNPSNAVIIIARTDDDELVLVDQYRPRFRMQTIGLPAGGIDEGEDPADAARRELREETGYRAGELSFVESYVPSGWTRYVRHVFLATDLTEGEPDPDEGEVIETLTAPVDEVLDVVRSREGPVNGLALTPLLLAREDELL
ncbi:ADP-ribose pyrophosphatase [Halomicrobium zhouii]|uniref:ADP-ribose pyrophosphatase n=1 Tax=Halomicrobium zhouii TaxID=767519 RepID=A0A1I6MB97_9EURY|nr:NUDIX hydrolase [Halomicrobium zhouii]SFS12873.1 ADP-ribose pyrophosphatase [Halomicrobium zhouii]